MCARSSCVIGRVLHAAAVRPVLGIRASEAGKAEDLAEERRTGTWDAVPRISRTDLLGIVYSCTHRTISRTQRTNICEDVTDERNLVQKQPQLYTHFHVIPVIPPLSIHLCLIHYLHFFIKGLGKGTVCFHHTTRRQEDKAVSTAAQ